MCYFLGILTALGIGIVFAYSYDATQIGFNPMEDGWDVETVQGALDSFRDIASHCPFGCPYAPGEIVYTSGVVNKEEIFVPECSGKYQLEVWGAQGGSYSTTYRGGFGGYSVGVTSVEAGTNIYIHVGGAPVDSNTVNQSRSGGYNGGGDSVARNDAVNNAGGGATHIALIPGTLRELEANKGTLVSDQYYESDRILIVAGGGGGAGFYSASRNGTGGSGGGYKGTSGRFNAADNCESYGNGGTQLAQGTYYISPGHWYSGAAVPSGGFGYGSTGDTYVGGNGGGGGFFGGRGNSCIGGGGGGSGYIASAALVQNTSSEIVNKLYCYGCEESNELKTYTVNTSGTTTHSGDRNPECTNGYSSTPLSGCAKAGGGYARITFLGN